LKPFAKIFPILFLVLFSRIAKGQDSVFASKKHVFFSYDSLHQVDIPDIARHLFRKKTALHSSLVTIKPSRVHVTAIPAAGYSLQTGWAGILSANITFVSGLKENISTITSSFTYSQYKQI